MLTKLVFSLSVDTMPLIIGLLNFMNINEDYGEMDMAMIAALLPFFFNMFIIIVIIQIFFFPKLRIFFDKD